MTHRFVVLNLSCLAIAHGLFLWITKASTALQPYLHLAFLMATIAYFFCLRHLRRRTSLPTRLFSMLLAGAVFYLLWSGGIVGMTRFAANGSPTLFYGTSGVQFWKYDQSAHAFFLLAFLPLFGVNLIASALLMKRF